VKETRRERRTPPATSLSFFAQSGVHTVVVFILREKDQLENEWSLGFSSSPGEQTVGEETDQEDEKKERREMRSDTACC
jgi:hypothetical protein